MLCDDLERWDGDGGGRWRGKRKGIYVCVWLIYFIVQQKLTQHYKEIILQKNNYWVIPLYHALCKMLWLHQELKQTGSQLRGQRIACDCLQPLFHARLPWSGNLNSLSLWAFSSPHVERAKTYPIYPPWWYTRQEVPTRSANCGEVHSQHSHWEPCLLCFQHAIERILAFPALTQKPAKDTASQKTKLPDLDDLAENVVVGGPFSAAGS